MTDDLAALLPCPFCGNRENGIIERDGHFAAICGNCDAEGEAGQNEAYAIKVWNTRQVPPVWIPVSPDTMPPVSWEKILALHKCGVPEITNAHIASTNKILFTHWIPIPPPPAELK